LLNEAVLLIGVVPPLLPIELLSFYKKGREKYNSTATTKIIISIVILTFLQYIMLANSFEPLAIFFEISNDLSALISISSTFSTFYIIISRLFYIRDLVSFISSFAD